MSASSPKIQCPHCQQFEGSRVVGQRAVCRQCSRSKRRVYQFCSSCRREWSLIGDGPMCVLPNCALRAALISPEVINKPKSSVYGCPFFRACPGCHTLLNHSGEGCPEIDCPMCYKMFCFRCLKENCYSDSDEEDYDDDMEDDDFNPLYEYEHINHARCTIVDNSQSIKALEL